MCELLGNRDKNLDPDELFMVGLLSAADALLDLPIDSIVAQLPVSDEVSEALQHHTGPAGSILDVVITYERGEFDAASLLAHRSDLAGAYRAALTWAQRTLDETI
jgi:EAL and modified HD-GYP domain-containing signal transduction protein